MPVGAREVQKTTSREELKKDYEKQKNRIRKRLSDFKEKLKQPEEEVFEELCFCLLTPQSKARKADEAVRELKQKKLLHKGSEKQVARILKKHTRFHNHKACYIIEAREKFSKKNIKAEKVLQTREWLVKNIKGLGYKEASHFLRNIGLGENIAILDRHVLKNLEKNKAIKGLPKNLSKKNYLKVEEEMREFSKKTKIPLACLDLLFWSKETGEIFK